jgi:hypothetical protein
MITRVTELTEMSADIVVFDQVLAHYGPETQEVRELLHDAVARILTLLWSQDSQRNPQMAPRAAGGKIIFDKIQELSPKNDAQHSLQAQALSMAIDLGKTRWLMFEQESSSISTPLLDILVFLARDYFHQLFPFRTPQCYRHGFSVPVRVRGWNCDLLDLGDVLAFPGADSDF